MDPQPVVSKLQSVSSLPFDFVGSPHDVWDQSCPTVRAQFPDGPLSLVSGLFLRRERGNRHNSGPALLHLFLDGDTGHLHNATAPAVLRRSCPESVSDPYANGQRGKPNREVDFRSAED